MRYRSTQRSTVLTSRRSKVRGEGCAKWLEETPGQKQALVWMEVGRQYQIL